MNFLSWDGDEEEQFVRSASTNATHGSALDSALMDDTDPVSKTSEWLMQMDGTHDRDVMQDATCDKASDIPDEMTLSECSDNDQHKPEYVPEPVGSTESLPVAKLNESSSCVQEPDNRPVPVICEQPTSALTGHITTRLGRSVWHPNRFICEIDSQRIARSDSHSDAQVIFHGTNFVVELIINICV